MKGVRIFPDRTVSGTVAHERGVQMAVDSCADNIGNLAKDKLKRHRDEGNAHIEVDHEVPSEFGEYGDIDSIVWLVDEPHQRSDGSWSKGDPLAIEFGHFHNRTGEYIEGLHVLYGAAGIL